MTGLSSRFNYLIQIWFAEVDFYAEVPPEIGPYEVCFGVYRFHRGVGPGGRSRSIAKVLDLIITA